MGRVLLTIWCLSIGLGVVSAATADERRDDTIAAIPTPTQKREAPIAFFSSFTFSWFFDTFRADQLYVDVNDDDPWLAHDARIRDAALPPRSYAPMHLRSGIVQHYTSQQSINYSIGVRLTETRGTNFQSDLFGQILWQLRW